MNIVLNVTVVRLQEIPSGSIYKKSSKNRAKVLLVLGHFCWCGSEWFVHDFYIQAQGGCQICLSAVKLDHSGELFLDTPIWLSAWVSVFWAWRMDLKKGVPTLFAYCEKLIWKMFFKFNQGTCPWMAFAWIFVGIFLIFLRGSVGQIVYWEYIVFRDSNISCSLACKRVGRMLWSSVSNAADRSSKVRMETRPSSALPRRLFVTSRRAVSVLWCARYADWKVSERLLANR